MVAANLVRPEDQGQHVLTIVLQMAHEQEQEELRMLASRLLLELAPTLGDPLSRQFVGPEIASLAQDPMFRVRKSVALNVHHLCRAASDDLLHGKLLPMLHDLARDDIWGVRKACAECLVNVAEGATLQLLLLTCLPLTGTSDALTHPSLPFPQLSTWAPARACCCPCSRPSAPTAASGCGTQRTRIWASSS